MDAGAEYRAATGAAAVFDKSARGKIAVAGRDRRTYLHAMLTNDVAALQPGGGCYAAFLTPQGRLMSDMRVLELGDLILLDLDPTVVPSVLKRLDDYVFSEDVQLGDVTETFGELTVVGPRAATFVAATLRAEGAVGPAEADLREWAEFRNVRASFRGEMVLLAGNRDLGVPGFDLYVERAHVDALGVALVAAGATAAGPETAEILRVEAGRPAFGVDMDADMIPLEAGIEGRAISFTKGCYPGQEIIIRVLHRGHGRVARRLVGLLVAGGAVPSRGDVLRFGDREAGRVTSAVMSPKMGRAIALAFVQHQALAPDAELVIVHGEERLAARVVPLPFEPGAATIGGDRG